nr:reverse transcriptase domain-containing protein [Tanacetum cinerariifolium]
MPPRMRTRSAGRPATESLGGGTGVRVGSGGKGRRPREGCSFKEFLAYNPKEYDGKGGVVVLTRWIEKMENVQDMSGCSIDQKVKYTAGSFVEFFPSHEMQKSEFELWNHVMVGAGHATYTGRFHELARLVPHLVTPKSRMIKRYVYGLAPQICGMVAATKPKTIQKAVQISYALTDEAVRNESIKKVEKRGNVGEPNMDKSDRDYNKRTKTGNVFATTINPRALKKKNYRSDLKPFLKNSKERPNLISLSKMSDHEEETINEENAHPKVVSQITTVTNISTKFPYLKKGEYDIWAMKMQNFISSFDLLCWNIVLKGNNAKSITTDKYGNLKIRQEHQQVQREEKAMTILLSALLDEHMGDFYHMIDARDIWNAIKVRFGGNAEFKKMQKSLLKQKFEEFKIFEEERLDKGYDKMQKIMSQMNTLKIKPETEDVNMKFLRGLPPSASFLVCPSTLSNVEFVSIAGSSQGNISYQESGNGSYGGYTATLSASPSSSSSKGSSKSKCSVVDDAAQEKQELMTKLDNEIANQAKCNKSGELGIDDSQFSIFHTNNDELEGQHIYNRFASVDHMKAVPPPLTGNYMPPSNIPDIDESQMVYGKKATDSSKIKTTDDSITHTNDSVLFDFSDRSSEPSTNDLKMCDSSVECSRPNHSDHDSTSSIYAPVSESRDTIVIDCDKQEDFPSVCSIETDVKSSKPFYLHPIKDCDLHEQRFTKRNNEGKGILKSRPRGKPVNPNRPKSVSAGRPKPVSVGRPNPASAGRPNPVFADQPNTVSAGDGILGPRPLNIQPKSTYFHSFTHNNQQIIFPITHNSLYSLYLTGGLNGKTIVKPSAGNKDKLEDFEDFDGGEVTFRGSTGKSQGKAPLKPRI